MLSSRSRIGQLLSLLLSFSLCLSIVAAAKSDDKVAKFTTLSTKSPKSLITLDDSLYDQIAKAPRDYTAVVLLTALDQRYGCALCRDFHPDFELMAKSSYGKQGPDSKLFFGSLDFGVGRATFQKVQVVEDMKYVWH